jgi:polyisoprenoid-binding protein YceI
VVVVAAAGWFLFIRSDAPPPVSLDAAVDQATSTTSADTAGTTGQAESTTTTAAEPPAGGASGVWVVTAEDSFVGYRVQEELSSIGAAEAVGRTSDVVGGMTIEGSNATAVLLEVDMSTLRSDSGQRDGQLESRGLETDSFPTATFVLTEPMDLGGEPQIGQSVSATAVGDLTLHGVTRQVQIPMEAQWVDDGTIVVIGSVDILITDYDIEAPVGFRILSINETGTIEIQLRPVAERHLLQRAADLSAQRPMVSRNRYQRAASGRNQVLPR